MNIEKVIIDNYGAIENLSINFGTSNAEVSPTTTIIVGSNGSGKTLFLSHIVDALIEMKRQKFGKMLEVQENNYYRVGQKSYIRHGKLHSYVKVLFRTNIGNQITYTDIMTKNNEAFLNEYDKKDIQMDTNDVTFKQFGYYKKVIGDVCNEFDNNILLYFPATRYFVPSWLNNENKSYKLSKDKTYVGQSSRNIIKENVLHEIENWILNLVLDKHLYEIKTEKMTIKNDKDQNQIIQRAIFTNGRNTQLLEMLNNLLSIIYRLKHPNIEYARIGISSKEDRKVIIIVKERNSNEIEVAPTFGHLSSGEAMLLSLFGSLLKEYDEISNGTFTNIKQVTGVVLIDEIDLNLHIRFAKEVLPDLIKQFPKVQFIITTHSPFFLLGMETKYKDNYKVFNLPQGEEISVSDFQEVQIAYETFLEGFTNLKKDFKILKEKLSDITNPLIITEGKTDWKHFKGVLNRFKEEDYFVGLDVEFFECDDSSSLSDDKLKKMLKELSKVNKGKKIIGVFDSDTSIGREFSSNRYSHLGNNVYAMCIPTPDFRKEITSGISIEFLYRDEDLLKCDYEGRRIFISNEFNDNGRLKSDNHIGVRNHTVVKGYLDISKSKIIDSDVIDIEGNSIALSKNAFAESVLNRTEPFQDTDIEGFREVFNIIEDIIFGGFK